MWASRVEYQLLSCASFALIEAKSSVSSSLPGFEMTEASFSARAPRCSSSVASPPSSRIMLANLGLPSASLPHSKMRWVKSQYSASDSPLYANTGTPVAAIAAAAWSWVEKMLHEAQRISAPSSSSVSMSTAVWMVMCSDPVMRAPASGFAFEYSSRIAMRPGISVSAIWISLRPQAASARSATWKSVKFSGLVRAFMSVLCRQRRPHGGGWNRARSPRDRGLTSAVEESPSLAEYCIPLQRSSDCAYCSRNDRHPSPARLQGLRVRHRRMRLRARRRPARIRGGRLLRRQPHARTAPRGESARPGPGAGAARREPHDREPRDDPLRERPRAEGGPGAREGRREARGLPALVDVHRRRALSHVDLRRRAGEVGRGHAGCQAAAREHRCASQEALAAGRGGRGRAVLPRRAHDRARPLRGEHDPLAAGRGLVREEHPQAECHRPKDIGHREGGRRDQAQLRLGLSRPRRPRAPNP